MSSSHPFCSWLVKNRYTRLTPQLRLVSNMFIALNKYIVGVLCVPYMVHVKVVLQSVKYLKYSWFSRKLSTSPLPKDRVVQGTPDLEETSKHEQVGITRLVGSHAKVKAILRDKYTDFHVHEIDVNGKLVQLTHQRHPTKKRPSDNEKYHTHCTLYKEGLSGPRAVNMMLTSLKIHPSRIRWAGMKDKNGLTTQRISVQNVDAYRLIQLSNNFKIMQLGNYEYSTKPISHGDLKGNHFKILMKNVYVEPSTHCSATETLERAVESFRQISFVNYFGLQRFGTIGIPFFVVGRAILQMNWEKVFDLILHPNPLDSDLIVRAKSMWLSYRDPVYILKTIHGLDRYFSVEAHLLNGLCRYYDHGKGDLIKSFQGIYKNTRLLYVLSFISYIWNHVASYRIEKFGFEPIPGDMVRVKNDDSQNTDPSIHNEEGDENVDKYADETKFKILTIQDLKNDPHKYSIYDVLLLGPGLHNSRYANPKLQEFYEEFLKANELDVNVFSNFYRETQVPRGFYRSLLVKPENVQHKIVPYHDEKTFNFKSLIPSDLELLIRARALPFQQRQSDDDSIESVSQKQKDKICAVLEFSLPPAAYATMALREIVDFPQGQPMLYCD